MVETGSFISRDDKTEHYSTDNKGGSVHFAALRATTKEEALKEVHKAVEYHGGLNHRFKYEGEYRILRKWSHLFLVENVAELPYEEWAQEEEDEFWRAQAEEKECAERAEYERLREKYGDHEEA
jgi:hypothetical protein